MNKILIVLLLVTNSALGQSHIEKYNSILERYEYYEGNTLVGYKEYNNVMDQWEYTDLAKKNSVESQPYSSPYRNLNPVETYDASSAYQVLAAKEARYESNVSQIKQLVDDLTYRIEDFSDLKKREMVYSRWTDFLEAFNNRTEMIDYSSSRTTQSVMNFFVDGFNRIVAETKTKNYKSAFNDLQSLYYDYSTDDSVMNFIKNDNNDDFLIIGDTRIPVRAVTAHYNLYTENGSYDHEVLLNCYKDISCIDDIVTKKYNPGVYIAFSSKESCMKFIQRFEALKSIL